MAAGTLTRVEVVPMTSIAGAYTTYDFFFRTATTGTVKTIEIAFVLGSGIDPRNATILIEKSNIGSGKLSGSINGTGVAKLTYTVTNPSTIAAGTTIRLEVPRISAQPGTWFANIATKDTAGNIIDGPTESARFRIG
jgi:hypothetical protein